MDDNQLLFALDIGTRSVIGLVGETNNGTISLLASDREEHNTRAMLDGQIHDVQEVAEVLTLVKERLESTVGPLSKVAVAAAGRALYTLRACAELDTGSRGLLTVEDERSLELAGIQTAQARLATSGTVPEPSDYYCVGYSVISFSLDGNPIKRLVGQRGKRVGLEVIATFLPRQVIDSLQSAVQAAGLEMSTLTLEPIAAINVLIPPTMRHLNLVLIDIGAGTSDIAITRDGSVVAYGMVPVAGDEITEAISQHFLLDFNVAEAVKRQLGSVKKKKLSFTDVLGMSHKLPAQDIINAMKPKVSELADAIAIEILALNTDPPQAVLLVGGGALTPLLPEALAQALDIPPARIAIRCPELLQGITAIPDELRTPDAVTPLGILKLAGGSTLSFVNVIVNERSIRLFNLSQLTVADALLAAGIDIRALRGRPGMGMTITVNGKTRFIAGSYGTPGQILLAGQPVQLNHRLHERDMFRVTLGTDGTAPTPVVTDVTPIPPPLSIQFDGEQHDIRLPIMINGQPGQADTVLHDRDQVEFHGVISLAQMLDQLGVSPEPAEHNYQVNGTPRSYKVWPQYTVNATPASLDCLLVAGDIIETLRLPPPTLGDILGISDSDSSSTINVLFNSVNCAVPVRRYLVRVGGRPAEINKPVLEDSEIELIAATAPQPLISDVLLAADFSPCDLPAASRVTVLLNGQAAEYTAAVKHGDRVDIKIESHSFS